MSQIEKKKNLFIITLDNGKQTYFDFNTNKFYGVSSREVKQFNYEAIKILKNNSNKNFLAYFFANWKQPVENITHIAETLYSLYSEKYTSATLYGAVLFCCQNNYELNSKNIKILTKALEIQNQYDVCINLKEAIIKATYPNVNPFIMDVVSYANFQIAEIILTESEKIMYYCEHENWLGFRDYDNYQIFCLLYNYIDLCEYLNKKRTYKDIFKSICLMQKEKELIAQNKCVDYQQNSNLFFENDNFTVIVPTTAKEFQDEAQYQHNCVFRLYFPKVIDKHTHVVFIRKKNDINTPYITCEVTNNGVINQYLTRFNDYVQNEEALNFKEEYQEYLNENFGK